MLILAFWQADNSQPFREKAGRWKLVFKVKYVNRWLDLSSLHALNDRVDGGESLAAWDAKSSLNGDTLLTRTHYTSGRTSLPSSELPVSISKHIQWILSMHIFVWYGWGFSTCPGAIWSEPEPPLTRDPTLGRRTLLGRNSDDLCMSDIESNTEGAT